MKKLCHFTQNFHLFHGGHIFRGCKNILSWEVNTLQDRRHLLFTVVLGNKYLSAKSDLQYWRTTGTQSARFEKWCTTTSKIRMLKLAVICSQYEYDAPTKVRRRSLSSQCFPLRRNEINISEDIDLGKEAKNTQHLTLTNTLICSHLL